MIQVLLILIEVLGNLAGSPDPREEIGDGSAGALSMRWYRTSVNPGGLRTTARR